MENRYTAPLSAGAPVARADIHIPLQVTIAEAARLLSFDQSTIRRLLQRGELISVGSGRLRRVDMESLYTYKQRHRN